MLHVKKMRQYIALVKYARTLWCLKIVRLFVNTWFGVVSWIITLSELNTVRQPETESIIDESAEENMGIKDDV
jgi:hypothetical protein